MKRRKQIGKLIYTPRWGQGDVELGKDYDGLSRDEKLDVLAQWITALLSVRNAMIPNPKSWHHFIGEKEWVGLTDEDRWELAQKTPDFAETVAAVEAKLKEKNT